MQMFVFFVRHASSSYGDFISLWGSLTAHQQTCLAPRSKFAHVPVHAVGAERTVKLDQEEVSKVKEPEAAKKEPTEAPKGGSSEAAAVQQYSSMIGPEASTYAAEADAASAGDKTASNAAKGADEAATNFEEGADQAADAVQDGLNQFSEGSLHMSYCW